MSVADYLRGVWDLGRRSMRPALPALAFLYFYRVGVGAYMAVAGHTTMLGTAAMADILPRVAVAASLLPVFMLIYTPMLPLQDSLLRGQPITFTAAVRRVLESAWALTVSGIAQGFAILAPFLLVCVAAALVMPDQVGEAMDPTKLFTVVAVAIAGLFGMFLAGVLLMFSTPALLLDGEGPLKSIGTSLRLVAAHPGAVLSRLLAFLFLSFVALIMLTMPTSILSQIGEAAGGQPMPMKVATVIWTSAVATLFFPFGVASLTVLYRFLVPYAGGARAGAPVPLDEEFQPTTATRVPFE
ncbi:MAG TPA: hypothetical protein VN539_08645 [Candidatus Saccharimonadales bacterium]|nr:hypothetical protein [Candidatus Saccharimonadales bacterium]